MDTIIAELSNGTTLLGSISAGATIIGNISISDGGSDNISVYDGEYVVVPKPHETQVLQTYNKLLEDDITVQEIPYYKVSNKTGNTVYIGKEIATNGNK